MVSRDQELQAIEKLRPIDDTLFELLARNPSVLEEILSIILENEKLAVKRSMTQEVLRNFNARSVILDSMCDISSDKQRLVDVEVQRSNNDDHLRRVRYNSSSITIRNTKEGEKFKDIPDVYIIYITEKDFLKLGYTTYHIGEIIRENGNRVDDGVVKVFVNAEIDDGTKTAALMKCFLQTKVEDDRFPKLSAEMKRLKETKGGVELMCKIIDDLIEGERDVIREEYNIKLASKDEQLASKDEQLASKDKQLAQKDAVIAELLAKLALV